MKTIDIKQTEVEQPRKAPKFKNLEFKDRFVFAELLKIAFYIKAEDGTLERCKFPQYLSSEKKAIQVIAEKLNYGEYAVKAALLRLKLGGYYRYDKEEEKLTILKHMEMDKRYFTTRVPVYLRKTFYLKDGSKLTWTALDQMIYDYVDSITKLHGGKRCKEENELLLRIQGIFYQKASTIAKKFGITRDEVLLVINKYKKIFGKRCFRRALYYEKWHRKHPRSFTYSLELPDKSRLRIEIEKFEQENCLFSVERERIHPTAVYDCSVDEIERQRAIEKEKKKREREQRIKEKTGRTDCIQFDPETKRFYFESYGKIKNYVSGPRY